LRGGRILRRFCSGQEKVACFLLRAYPDRSDFRHFLGEKIRSATVGYVNSVTNAIVPPCIVDVTMSWRNTSLSKMINIVRNGPEHSRPGNMRWELKKWRSWGLSMRICRSHGCFEAKFVAVRKFQARVARQRGAILSGFTELFLDRGACKDEIYPSF